MELKRHYSLFALIFCFQICGSQAFSQISQGTGCTTATMIDWDCDGYGPGSPLGPDADDNDASVNTSSTALARYGSASAILSHLGYHPLRNFYIATNGNDANGQPNNESAPYASWNKVISLLQPGDAVIWRAGTYSHHPSLALSGTPANPIILMAYPGEKVILDETANGIDFVGQSNITIDGLILQNSANGLGEGIFFGDPAVNITIRNVELTKRGRGILGMNGLSNVLIERSVMHDTTAEHCVYLGAREKPDANVTLRYNVIHHGSYNGVQFNGRVTNLVVDSNIIHSNLLSALSFLEGVSNSTIKNNLLFGNGRNCMLIWDYPGDPNQNINPYDQVNNTFVNNTCWVGSADATGVSISQPAINIDNGGYNVSLDGHRFENNIFVTQNYAVFKFGQMRYLNTTTIKNNLMLNVGGGPYLNYGGTNYTFSSLNTLDSLKGGNLQGDPLFKAVQTAWFNAPQNFDFTLQAGSPAIGLSIAGDAPSLDLRQGSRGAAPDAGAYQYGQSGGGAAAGLRVTTLALSSGTVGAAYSQTLSASGGTTPYSWSLAAGSLPAGLVLSSAGMISGTPSAAGPSTFTVKVTDGASKTATADLSIIIANGTSQQATLSSLTCAQSTVPSNSSTTCTVTLSRPPSDGATVTLSNSTQLLTTPASVTVAAGSTSATFTATTSTISPNPHADNGAWNHTITATLGGSSASASITLTPSGGGGDAVPKPNLSSITCSPDSLPSNSSATCTVTLSGPAPSSGAEIDLTDDSRVLTAPEWIRINAGAASGTFVAITGNVQSARTVTIMATYNGASRTTTIALRANQ